MKKQNPSKLDRVWLDPQKSSSNPVLPRWEGTINPPPQYMDLVLYILHSIKKNKLKQWANTNKHLSFKETLCGFFHYNPEVHGLCLTDSQSDKVFLIAKSEYGYAKAWSRSTLFSNRFSQENIEENEKKWDSVVVEFETTVTDSQVYKQYGKSQPSSKMLTMQDTNFLLARSCTVVDESELEAHMSSWIDGESSKTFQNGTEREGKYVGETAIQ